MMNITLKIFYFIVRFCYAICLEMICVTYSNKFDIDGLLVMYSPDTILLVYGHKDIAATLAMNFVALVDCPALCASGHKSSYKHMSTIYIVGR